MERARASLDEVEAFARAARQAAEAGDLDAASKALSRVLALMPTAPRGWRAVGAARQPLQGAGGRGVHGDESRGRDRTPRRRQLSSRLRRSGRVGRARGIGVQQEAVHRGGAAVPRSPARPTRPRGATHSNSPRSRARTPAAAEAPPTTSAVAAPTSAPTRRSRRWLRRHPRLSSRRRPPATPLPKTTLGDEAAVRQLVASFERAIEEKDLALYKRLRPGLTPEDERRLRDAFNNVSSQQVDFSVDALSFDGRQGDPARDPHRTRFRPERATGPPGAASREERQRLGDRRDRSVSRRQGRHVRSCTRSRAAV